MTQKKALIVWGGWDGHTPEQSAGIVKDMLETHGYKVTLDTTTEAFADPNLSDFDLIVPAITMATIEMEEVKNLLNTIRKGTGFAGFHGLMCDSFRNEPAYQFMTGGQWVAHPGGIIDYSVQVTKPTDPIVSGIAEFAYTSEQYYMHFDPLNEVLATTTFQDTSFDEINGVEMPVVWKRRYGKGRVFFSALGHVADEFKIPEMKTIFERGALWAARAA